MRCILFINLVFCSEIVLNNFYSALIIIVYRTISNWCLINKKITSCFIYPFVNKFDNVSCTWQSSKQVRSENIVYTMWQTKNTNTQTFGFIIWCTKLFGQLIADLYYKILLVCLVFCSFYFQPANLSVNCFLNIFFNQKFNL